MSTLNEDLVASIIEATGSISETDKEYIKSDDQYALAYAIDVINELTAELKAELKEVNP